MENDPAANRVFLTGATGYIGGRLGPRLLAEGWHLRCLARSARKLQSRPWAADPRVQVVEADLADTSALADALRGCDAAYYLVHSMEVAGSDYIRRDRELARAFARAAAQANVRRIIYLGGLGEMGDGLSQHLSSRREVEHCLADGPVPLTVLRAAMVIGSGSASFEILRYLCERLPVMVTPRWVSTECQPIAIADVLRYLVQCLRTPATTGQTLDIGGPQVLTYRQMIQLMAAALGLRRRLIVPVPLLTPRLSSLWIHLVTPVSYRVARPLAEGLKNRVVCRDDRAQRLMPGPLMTVREAVAAALADPQLGPLESAWGDAGVLPGDPDWAGGKVFVDRRSTPVAATPQAVFDAVCRLGGQHGYHRGDWLWHIRGLIDRLAGGPGLRRIARDPGHPRFGDPLDFWRVVGIDPPRTLSLRAEMRLPGVALLEFEVSPAPDGTAILTQTARFKPRGLAGLAYWYAVLPLHGYVFSGMLQGIRREAEKP